MGEGFTARVSGEAYLEERLGEVERRVRKGAACEVAFDLDNTFFDTRGRTAWVAHRFDETCGTDVFATLDLDRVGSNARETCARMGNVPKATAEAFDRFWSEAFWQESALAYDMPVESVVIWAHRAARAGAALRFLTGRVEALRQATVQQLARAGFAEITPASPWMKPDLANATLPFKAAMLQKAMLHAWLGWYVTEGRDEVAYLQEVLPGGPWVLVDCSLQEQGPPVTDGTPTLARTF